VASSKGIHAGNVTIGVRGKNDGAAEPRRL